MSLSHRNDNFQIMKKPVVPKIFAYSEIFLVGTVSSMVSTQSAISIDGK